MSDSITVDTARLPLLLGELRLPTVAKLWQAFTERADREGWPSARLLATLVELELAERAQRRIQRHLLEARLPPGKTLGSFDFTTVPMVSHAHVTALASGDAWLATLGLKEMTQGTLIRKLCTYTQPNPTRRAIFEFDKLVRSIYTLRYLRNPQLQRDVQRSQNRLESYHQLRAAIAQVGGKKELTGKTDIEIEISNQCARLIANAIIYYNSAILSRLLTRYGPSPGVKALAMIKKISPAAWRHIHLNGRYTFRDNGQVIDLDAIVAGLNLS